jgi:enterochelin esterase-like enzyme
MGKRLLLLGCFLLSGCALASPVPTVTPAPTATPEPVCDEPGTTHLLEIDSPTRGYPYKFGLFLPPCYASRPEKRYPVLYLIPWRSGGPSDWFAAGAAETADGMIRSGEIPPFLIVATSDTDADPNAEAIQKDLMPHIEQTYRIQPGRAYHAVAGGSLGGVAAYRIALGNPSQFGAAGMFGIGAIQGEEEKIRAWLAAMNGENRVRVFFNCGLQDTYMLDRAKVTIALLDEFQIPHEELFTDGGHIYGYWADNLPVFYRWLAREWR